MKMAVQTVLRQTLLRFDVTHLKQSRGLVGWKGCINSKPSTMINLISFALLFALDKP